MNIWKKNKMLNKGLKEVRNENYYQKREIDRLRGLNGILTEAGTSVREKKEQLEKENKKLLKALELLDISDSSKENASLEYYNLYRKYLDKYQVAEKQRKDAIFALEVVEVIASNQAEDIPKVKHESAKSFAKVLSVILDVNIKRLKESEGKNE